MNDQHKHADGAPYVEQSGRLQELEASFSVDEDAKPPTVRWTCPVCGGEPQEDEVKFVTTVGITSGPPRMDVTCQCGHAHGEHGGCGYGARVPLPESLVESGE